MSQLIYFSSVSGNTQRFIRKLDLPATQLPTDVVRHPFMAEEPYILVCPTYADGKGRNAVPKSVIHFLNNRPNRELIRGVIASGNRNFGQLFAAAGDIIAKKCHVPVLYRFELAGTENDIRQVRNGLSQFWSELC